MKVVFSRKGFDQGAGGCPSPIVDGIPLSLPIPQKGDEPYVWEEVVHPLLGPIAPHLPKQARIEPGARPHWDPLFHRGKCYFGQSGAALSHLENEGVGIGDLILFWGLFRDYGAPRTTPNAKPHHRIFGWMRISCLADLSGSFGPGGSSEFGLPIRHPHCERRHQPENNRLFCGPGGMARRAETHHRLTADGAPPSLWSVPDWLIRHRMSYHRDAARWGDGTVQTVARGQEFVSAVGEDPEALSWVRQFCEEMNLSAD